jgi:SpoVK/Ycf46/Vps4 family AAA+-type ATPase
VIFIDEIDAIFKGRGGSDSSWRRDVVRLADVMDYGLTILSDFTITAYGVYAGEIILFWMPV